MMTSIILAVVGGALIGLAASLLLYTIGRIAGISGIVGGLLHGGTDRDWRFLFLAGLLFGGLMLNIISPDMFALSSDRTTLTTVVAGFIVGIGVRMGSGCTSGHGVCGISRFSTRSIVATLSFMTTGIVTATIIEIFFGGML